MPPGICSGLSISPVESHKNRTGVMLQNSCRYVDLADGKQVEKLGGTDARDAQQTEI
ncbi:MAG: hypothetical protein PVG59_04170 [Desulfobacterales bacterium]|jgi:hypothetical protein